MSSIQARYNQEVLEGHREALAALRELLATETDRTERRRLANAILKTRPVEDPEAPKQPELTNSATSRHAKPTRAATPNNTDRAAAAPQPRQPDGAAVPSHDTEIVFVHDHDLAPPLSNPQRTG